MAGKYIESVKRKRGINFINPPQDGSKMSGLLTFKLWSFKENEVLLAITYNTGMKGKWLG